MKRLRIGTIVVALSLMALPAHAAKVGLAGGDFDPAPISDPSVFAFGACNGSENSIGDPYFNNYRCIFYDFPDLDENESLDDISSIEFRLFEALAPYFSEFGFEVDERSDLPCLNGGCDDEGNQVPGAFRLSGGLISPCFIECGDDGPITGLVLFVGPSTDDGEPLETIPDNLTGQVVAVNGQVTVPEPATLLMLGPGFAAIFVRRRVRSKQR